MSTPPKSESPLAGGQVAKQGTENVSIVALRGDDNKQFFTLRAQFALLGHALHRIDSKDGPAAFYAERWGMVRYLPSLADARRFLAQIGGGRL